MIKTFFLTNYKHLIVAAIAGVALYFTARLLPDWAIALIGATAVGFVSKNNLFR